MFGIKVSLGLISKRPLLVLARMIMRRSGMRSFESLERDDGAWIYTLQRSMTGPRNSTVINNFNQSRYRRPGLCWWCPPELTSAPLAGRAKYHKKNSRSARAVQRESVVRFNVLLHQQLHRRPCQQADICSIRIAIPTPCQRARCVLYYRRSNSACPHPKPPSTTLPAVSRLAIRMHRSSALLFYFRRSRSAAAPSDGKPSVRRKKKKVDPKYRTNTSKNSRIANRRSASNNIGPSPSTCFSEAWKHKTYRAALPWCPFPEVHPSISPRTVCRFT